LKLDLSTVIETGILKDNDRTQKDIALYLNSEAGEVADWLLNPNKRKESLLGECSDVIICVVDLAFRHLREDPDLGRLSDDQLKLLLTTLLQETIKQKCHKWANK